MATLNTFLIWFDDINIQNDGDFWGKGEVYFRFKVDRIVVSTNQISGPYDEDVADTSIITTGPYIVSDGGRIPCSNYVIIKRKSTEFFKVEVSVWENDGLAGTGAGYRHFNVFNGSDGWWETASVGSKKTIILNFDENSPFSFNPIEIVDNLVSDKLKCSTSYHLTLQSSTEIYDPGPPIDLNPGESIEADPDIFTVTLYETINYNQRPVRVGPHFQIPLHSQVFSAGSYDLPYTPLENTEIHLLTKIVYPKSVASTRVGSRMLVVFYDKIISERNTAQSIAIFENTPILPDDWNSRVMSIDVELMMPH